MADIMISANSDGTYLVEVGHVRMVFPDFMTALEWAESENEKSNKE